MITKLLCWVWGHKTVVKAITGNAIQSTNQLTGNLDTIPLYTLERKDFCVRCGKIKKLNQI